MLRTGRYKWPTVISGLASGTAFTTLLLFWWGRTTILQSFLIFPAGFATGVAHSAVFIGLTSGVKEDEVAIAGTGLYLSGSVGAVVGSSTSSALFQFALESGLKKAVYGLPHEREVSGRYRSMHHWIY
jgi:hypothetical protein